MAFTMPFGMFSPPIAYAMVLRRHMHRFGTTVEQMGHVAVTTQGPRGEQPPRRDGRSPHDDGRLPRVAHGVGALPPLRLLPRERRRLRGGRHHRRAAPPTLPRHPVAVLAAAQGALQGSATASTPTSGMPDDDYASAGAAGGGRPAVGSRRGRARRHRRGRDLRPLHRARPAQPGGLRLLRAGRGRSLRGVGRAGVARRGAAHQHPRRAACRRPTSTASTTSSKGCASCAASPRARSREPRRAWSRARRACPRAPWCWAGDDGCAMTERWFPDEMPMPAANAETVGWWEAAADHRLVVQRCTECGQHPPSPGPGVPPCRSSQRSGRSSRAPGRCTPTPSCARPSSPPCGPAPLRRDRRRARRRRRGPHRVEPGRRRPRRGDGGHGRRGGVGGHGTGAGGPPVPPRRPSGSGRAGTRP